MKFKDIGEPGGPRLPRAANLALADMRMSFRCAKTASMTTKELGNQLVEFCKAGKNDEAIKSLYANDIVSVEAGAPPGQPREAKGLAACVEKGKQWAAAHEVHSAAIEGPYPHDDRFTVVFHYDITRRADKQRFTMKEVGLFTVKNDKIVREEFFYSM